MMTTWRPTLTARQRLALGGAALLAIGVAGGAGAMSLTRPSVEMAPSVPTPVAKLAAVRGIVTVRGRVAETYGDRFIVQDGSGRVLVDAGRGHDDMLAAGNQVTVQGRYDNGQLKARFLVDAAGNVEEVGPPEPPHGRAPRPVDGPPLPGGEGPPPPGATPPPVPANANAPLSPPADVGTLLPRSDSATAKSNPHAPADAKSSAQTTTPRP